MANTKSPLFIIVFEGLRGFYIVFKYKCRLESCCVILLTFDLALFLIIESSLGKTVTEYNSMFSTSFYFAHSLPLEILLREKFCILCILMIKSENVTS